MLSIQRLIAASALSLSITSCGASECFQPPCPFPMAITVTITSTVPALPIGEAFVESSIGGPSSCIRATCTVMGTPGKYELNIGATGFQTTHRTVNVTGTNPRCGCPRVDVQHLNVALTPTP
jgi:hypothetical protein